MVDTLVVFAGSRKFDGKEVADAIAEEMQARLTPDQIVFVVRASLTAYVKLELLQSPSFSRLWQRSKRQVGLTLVSFDGLGQEKHREVLLGSHATEIGLSEIYRRLGTAIFRERNGFVDSTNAYHFSNPSGKHTSRFIRLSNILVTQAEINLLAAASLHLVPVDAVRCYIDTPSLFALVAAISDYRYTEISAPPLHVDSFRSYEGVRELDFEYDGSFVLISASSSGSLAQVLQERGFQSNQIGHVLFLGTATRPVTVAIDLSHDTSLNPLGYPPDRVTERLGTCLMCEQDSRPIALKGDQFDIPGPQPDPLLITKEHAPKNLSDIMSRLIGTGACKIRTGRTSRQFEVDIGCLLLNEKVLEKLEYLAKGRVPAATKSIIVIDDSSRVLATRMAEWTGINCAVTSFAGFEDRVEREPGLALQPVLVVAAAIGGGRALLDISRDLRSYPKAPITFFVAIAKPESVARVKTLRSNLAMSANPGPNAVIIAEELALPMRDAPNPWDREADLLQSRSNNGRPLSNFLKERLEHLVQSGRPIHKDIFLPGADGSLLKLQEGFVFKPEGRSSREYTQADVHYTIAAVLQKLRTEAVPGPAKSLRSEWFYQTILDPENFGRYNDGVIQASILRAARPSELDYSDTPTGSRDARRLIQKIIASANKERGDAACEFLLALATKRLRLVPEDLTEVLKIEVPGNGLAKELQTIAREQLEILDECDFRS